MGDSSLQPEGAAVASVTAILVSGLPPATMIAMLSTTLGGFGITPGVVTATTAMVLKAQFSPTLPPGPAAQAVAVSQANFRAAYLIAASVRMQNDVNAGMQLRDALAREMVNYQRHLAAQQNRRRAADAVDIEAGNDPTRLLIWHAKMDSRTSPECAAANGLTFTAATVPIIGYPGMVHPHCRCKAKRAPLGTHAKHVDTAMSPALIGAH